MPNQQAPGFQPYTPTRIEWAALQLQAIRGERSPTQWVSFFPDQDGETILCIVQLAKSTPLEAMKKLLKDLTGDLESYRQVSGWPWLQFRIEELPLE